MSLVILITYTGFYINRLVFVVYEVDTVRHVEKKKRQETQLCDFYFRELVAVRLERLQVSISVLCLSLL